MSISKERWIKTGDPRSGFEVYDDEGNEQCCSECDDPLEPKTADERVYVALFGAHRECLENLTPADHADRIKKLSDALRDAAWFKFEADRKRLGMVASAYTAFNCGYRAGKFDYETEGR